MYFVVKQTDVKHFVTEAQARKWAKEQCALQSAGDSPFLVGVPVISVVPTDAKPDSYRVYVPKSVHGRKRKGQ